MMCQCPLSGGPSAKTGSAMYYNWCAEPFADSERLVTSYSSMHGLIFRRSIRYWQDQPGKRNIRVNVVTQCNNAWYIRRPHAINLPKGGIRLHRTRKLAPERILYRTKPRPERAPRKPCFLTGQTRLFPALRSILDVRI